MLICLIASENKNQLVGMAVREYERRLYNQLDISWEKQIFIKTVGIFSLKWKKICEYLLCRNSFASFLSTIMLV